MSAIIFPLLIILIALGGIVALIGRRMHMNRQRSSLINKPGESTGKTGFHLGPIRATLRPPHHSRLQSIKSGAQAAVGVMRSGFITVASAIMAQVRGYAPVVLAFIRNIPRAIKKRRSTQYGEQDIPELEEVSPAQEDQDLAPVVPKPKPKAVKADVRIAPLPAPEKIEDKKEKPTPVPVVEETPAAEPRKSMRRRVLRQLTERKLPVDEARGSAESLIEQGNTTEAESLLIDILSKNPRDIEAYRLLGIVYLRNEDFGQAIEVFEEAIRRDSSHVGIHGPLGDCYLVKGEYSKALSAYQRAHEQDEENIEYLEGLLYIASRMDRVPLVQGITGKILAINPNHEDAKKALERIKVRG